MLFVMADLSISFTKLMKFSKKNTISFYISITSVSNIILSYFLFKKASNLFVFLLLLRSNNGGKTENDIIFSQYDVKTGKLTSVCFQFQD